MSSKDHLRRASEGLEFALDYASPRERRHFRRAFWHGIPGEERQQRKKDGDHLVIDSVVEQDQGFVYTFVDGSVVSITPTPDNLFSFDERSYENDITHTISGRAIPKSYRRQSQPQVRRVLYTTESHQQNEGRVEDGPVGYFRMRAVQRDLERRLGRRLTQDHFHNDGQTVSVIADMELVNLPQGSYAQLPAAQGSQRTDVIPSSSMLLMVTKVDSSGTGVKQINLNDAYLRRIIDTYRDSSIRKYRK